MWPFNASSRADSKINFNAPEPQDFRYRIIETVDGRFFPQVWGQFIWMLGEQAQWCYINEFSAKAGKEAWYTTYMYEAKPLDLERYCYSKSECERIIKAYDKQYKDRFLGGSIKKEYLINL